MVVDKYSITTFEYCVPRSMVHSVREFYGALWVWSWLMTASIAAYSCHAKFAHEIWTFISCHSRVTKMERLDRHTNEMQCIMQFTIWRVACSHNNRCALRCIYGVKT